MDNSVPVESVKAEKEEKKPLPWFSNPPMSYENYAYSAPFPSPLPSPLDQTQNSLFTSFEGDQSFAASPPLWYSQMLDGHDMKSFYLMRHGFGNQGQASEALESSPSMSSTIGGSVTPGSAPLNTIGGPVNGGGLSPLGGPVAAQNGSLTSMVGSMNPAGSPNVGRRDSMSSLSASMHPGHSGTMNTITGSSNGLQSPPVTPYLNENLNNLGSLHQQQLRAMMQLRAMGYGMVRPQLSSDIGVKKDENISLPGDSGSRNLSGMKNMEKEKPFQCSYPGCEARFPRMYNLKSHMLCHTGMRLMHFEPLGERPHVCPLECGAKFARKHDLQRHMRTLHSPNRPFQCPYEKCQQAFRRANSFWRHLVEDHPDKSSEHAEIYQRAVQQQKVNQEGKNVVKPPLAVPAPIEIPLSAPSLHAVENMSGPHADPFFTSVPRLNDSMIYRDHFN